MIDFRERGREKETEAETEKHWLVVPLIHASIGWFLYVPWLGIERATLAYRDVTLINWATGQGQYFILLFLNLG